MTLSTEPSRREFEGNSKGGRTVPLLVRVVSGTSCNILLHAGRLSLVTPYTPLEAACGSCKRSSSQRSTFQRRWQQTAPTCSTSCTSPKRAARLSLTTSARASTSAPALATSLVVRYMEHVWTAASCTTAESTFSRGQQSAATFTRVRGITSITSAWSVAASRRLQMCARFCSCASPSALSAGRCYWPESAPLAPH